MYSCYLLFQHQPGKTYIIYKYNTWKLWQMLYCMCEVTQAEEHWEACGQTEWPLVTVQTEKEATQLKSSKKKWKNRGQSFRKTYTKLLHNHPARVSFRIKVILSVCGHTPVRSKVIIPHCGSHMKMCVKRTMLCLVENCQRKGDREDTLENQVKKFLSIWFCKQF